MNSALRLPPKKALHCLGITTNCQPALGDLLPGELLWLGLFSRLLNCLLFLFQDHLPMSWAVHVWANTTVGTVSATASLLSSVHLDVLDDQVVSVQVLELSVALAFLRRSMMILADLTGQR